MLTIPMKVVLNLGDGRLQLACMCDVEFTFAPNEKINSDDEQKAICPNCKSIWDGEVGEIDARNFKFRFFIFHGEFADPAIQKRVWLNENGKAMLYMARGVDMFSTVCKGLCHIAPFGKLKTVTITEIDRHEFKEIEAKLENEAQRRMEEHPLNLLFGGLMSEQPEEGKDD